MQKWNTLCKDVLEKKAKEASEQEYQELIYNHFRLLLGWHSERVEKQYKLGWAVALTTYIRTSFTTI